MSWQNSVRGRRQAVRHAPSAHEGAAHQREPSWRHAPWQGLPRRGRPPAEERALATAPASPSGQLQLLHRPGGGKGHSPHTKTQCTCTYMCYNGSAEEHAVRQLTNEKTPHHCSPQPLLLVSNALHQKTPNVCLYLQQRDKSHWHSLWRMLGSGN